MQVASYSLLVDAGAVIGRIADEMPVWIRGRPVPTGDGSAPTDLAEVQIWVREGADAGRARRLLEAEPLEPDAARRLAPLPPATMSVPAPASSADGFHVGLLRIVVSAAVVSLGAAVLRHCG